MNLKQIKVKLLLLLVLFTTVLACTKEEVLENNLTSNTKESLIKKTPSLRRGVSVISSDYYALPVSFPRTVDFISDNDFDTDDSTDLQLVIDSLYNLGGGRIKIPAGNYTFSNIQMKENVHIEVDKGATFKPKQETGRKSIVMFVFSSDNKNNPLKNVSLYCTNGRFKVDMRSITPDGRGVRMCFFRNVDGFYVSNINVLDRHTQFSAFVFNGETIEERAYGPTNGVLMNVNTDNSDYGYGLVQMQLGKNIFFRNISGTGGTTLRIETHNVNLRPLNAVNVIENIVARNVRCKDGNAAVMLSPHFMDNGYVDISNVFAENSGFAVRIEKGFVAPKELLTHPNLVPGTFDATSIIRNVKAVYGTTAQLKPKHYGFMLCEERNRVSFSSISSFPHGDSFEGPSIAPVLYDSNYVVNFNEDYVIVSEGFDSATPKVVTNKFDCN